MGNERFCDCGSVADWQEIGSTWICVACRDKEVQKNIDELKNALKKMEAAEVELRKLKAGTLSMPELLMKLEDEISRIQV
jgi:hypothetical protein